VPVRSAGSTICLRHQAFLLSVVIGLTAPWSLFAQSSTQKSTNTISIADQVKALRVDPVALPLQTPLPPKDSLAEPEVIASSQTNAGMSAATAEPPKSPAVAVPGQAVVAGAATTPIKPKYDVRLIGQRDVGTGINFYSLDREMAVGRELSRQVESTSKLVTDPVVTEYINRIGQNLVRNSDARVPFTIKVIDNEEVNAFALPGGFFYVDTGLILAADNEAELAAVMAHEIAHVAARHATKNMTKSEIWNLASIPLMFIGGPAGYAIAEVASLAVPLSFLKFSRDAEREADLLGLEYDYAAGYDPQAFVQFFEKLNADDKKKHSKLAKMFSTHPMNGDRVTAAQNEIRQYLPDRDSYIVDTSDFDQVKAHLLALNNSQHLGAMDNRRPVLLKRTGPSGGTNSGSSTDAGSTSTDSSSGSGQEDPDRPTLKRNPQSQ
jgi:predicted Zn-dependent protease